MKSSLDGRRRAVGQAQRHSARSRRNGKVLVLLAVLLPTLCGILGLVLDCGLMMAESRSLQHATDSAATAAATDLRLGKSAASATATATDFVHLANGRASDGVQVHIPPIAGKFAGRAGYVEVDTDTQYTSKFSRVLSGIIGHTVRTHAIAGVDNVTAGAAIVVLDPNPIETAEPTSEDVGGTVQEQQVANAALASLNVNSSLSGLGLGALLAGIQARLTASLDSLIDNAIHDAASGAAGEFPSAATPTLTAGMEIEGLGNLKVDGAILVNNQWGGLDEHGEQVGEQSPIRHAVSCMPLVSTTQCQARDIRVVGGVDRRENYQNFVAGKPSPLSANRLPVPDPFHDLLVPSVASYGANVSPAVHNPSHALVVSIGPDSQFSSLLTSVQNDVLAPLIPIVRATVEPIITPTISTMLHSLLTPTTLTPGVYDSITVISTGNVRFEPGIYIIRSTSPYTNMALTIVGGSVQAEGVLFYITDAANFDAASGQPDTSDDSNAAPPNPPLTSKPSVHIAPLLPGSHISGLQQPGNPLNGMLIYQRRIDRRPIVITATKLAGGGEVSGTIYSKWGHVVFVGGSGSYDLRIVSGTLRVANAFDSTIAPTQLLPPAQDVLLAE
jgi:hypothetical protein